MGEKQERDDEPGALEIVIAWAERIFMPGFFALAILGALMPRQIGIAPAMLFFGSLFGLLGLASFQSFYEIAFRLIPTWPPGNQLPYLKQVQRAFTAMIVIAFYGSFGVLGMIVFLSMLIGVMSGEPFQGAFDLHSTIN